MNKGKKTKFFFASILNFFSSKASAQNKINYDDKDLHFHHDFMNHLHGIKLFLEQKENLGGVIKGDDLQSLRSELEQMGHLVEEHFNIRKNEFINLEEARNLLESIVEKFLPSSEFQVRFIQNCELVNNKGIASVPFIRVVTNLIKNISESGRSKVQITIDFKDELELKFTNSLNTRLVNDGQIGEKLGQIVLSLDDKREKKHFGLAAIEKQVQNIGGSFDFFIEDSNWISTVRFPLIRLLERSPSFPKPESA